MRKAVHIAIEVITWIVIGALALFLVYSVSCRITGKSVSLFGYQADVVQSESMEPNLYKDDLVIVKHVSEEEIAIKDVLVFRRDGKKYVHRLISYEDGLYTTQGDANDFSDKPITYEAIEGKVVSTVPKIGGVIQFFQSVYGIIITVAIIVAVFCFRKLYQILREDSDGEEGSSRGDNHEEA